MEDLIIKYDEDSVLKPNLTNADSRWVAMKFNSAIFQYDSRYACKKDGEPTGYLTILEHLESLGFDSKSLTITIKKKR